MLFLAIVFPIVIIGVLIIIFFFIKCKRKKENDVHNNEVNYKIEAITRKTANSSISGHDN